MTLRDATLHDRTDLSKRHVLLSGVQALTRLVLMQKARDRAAGLNTAGYVTGYRGSPVGGVDMAFMREAKQHRENDIVFQPGLNEDLAVTAIWGAQQAELRGDGAYDGVFSLFYAKGPGIDRSGDALRHANLAGTSPHGGALIVMGDDHTCESSTTCHQSEFALVDAMCPILAPAGVQEVLDYGVIGWALSRYCGMWVGIKSVKDIIEATAVVDGAADRVSIVTPPPPAESVSIRAQDTPQAQEARLHGPKRAAAVAFGRANRLDRRALGEPGARIGFVAAGKSWLDLAHALHLLGIDEARAQALGLSAYKVGMVWPLEPESAREFSDGLDLLVIVEEKRSLIEVQFREEYYDLAHRPRIIGKTRNGETLFPATMALDPVMIARKIGAILIDEGAADDALRAALARLEAPKAPPALAERKPWFCAGCPHNSSTKLPEGARGYAGIGCHYMVSWMDRATSGYTHMGAEGANWIGEAPFSTREHMFVNLGDGTYTHSGYLAIRAAIAAKVNLTYKLLYNDAVAMTGGQQAEGAPSPYRIAAELAAMGCAKVIAVYDPKEDFDPAKLPAGIEARTRDRLMETQKDLAATPGVTALLYVQTCAAEKRRRRKRGSMPTPEDRVFINPEICEGCGDCGKASNCVAVKPLHTPLGVKREIDQSACNRDFSCVDGFCPSFVSVRGGALRRAAPKSAEAEAPLPAPAARYDAPLWSGLICGVGGTGVVTIGAVLGMAAHLEGKGAGVMEMAGLAQKGGAVFIHVRIADRPEGIHAIRLADGEADCVIGGDLVVTGGAKALGLMRASGARAVVDPAEVPTGDFSITGDARLPGAALKNAIAARAETAFVAAHDIAEGVLGDAIYANMILLGAAWQAGMIPLDEGSILRAIELNGASPEANKRAFTAGRRAMLDEAPVVAAPVPTTLAQIIEDRAARLTAYQNAAYADRYRAIVAQAQDADGALGREDFTRAVAQNAYKVMAYKDEYEVARLHAETTAALVASRVEGAAGLSFHLAPPFMGGKKRRFGGWMAKVFPLLARGKALRGGALDIFGYTAERRAEQALRDQYLGDIAALCPHLGANYDRALELARLPEQIKGFGHVKAAAILATAKKRTELLG